MPPSLRRIFSGVRTDLKHWLVTGTLIAISILAGKALEERNTWISLRYSLYQRLQDLSPREPRPHWVTIVTIDDDEYWNGELARRVPIKRDYLAKLLRTLSTAHPRAIALDFDFRSPTGNKSAPEHPDYKNETEELTNAIIEVSRRQRIVLPRTLNMDSNGNYVTEVAIYDDKTFSPRVRTGYIELGDDIRTVPPRLKLQNGQPVDSFSLAIARTIYEDVIGDSDAVPYGTFMEREKFDELPASQVFNMSRDGTLEDRIGGRLVLVGADWHRLAHSRGDIVDSYDTPVGMLGGVFIHSNYVEALLDSRTFTPLSERIAMGVEIIFSIAVALLLSLKMRGSAKLGWFIGICLLLLLATYVFWQNFGLFFDFFIPLFLLAAHALYEHVIEWRRVARKCLLNHRQPG